MLFLIKENNNIKFMMLSDCGLEERVGTERAGDSFVINHILG